MKWLLGVSILLLPLMAQAREMLPVEDGGPDPGYAGAVTLIQQRDAGIHQPGWGSKSEKSALSSIATTLGLTLGYHMPI